MRVYCLLVVGIYFDTMEASWTNIFWILMVCIFIVIILISVGCNLRKQCRTEGKQEISSLERNDSIRTQVSICSVWAVDEDGRQGHTDLGGDTTESEATPPDVVEKRNEE